MNCFIPLFASGQSEIDTAFRIACGDLTGNVALFQDGLLNRPALVILAGADYSSPWTRDAAFNTWYAGFVCPEVARNTLLSVLQKDENGIITIGGEYWDKIIWAIGAWQYQLWNEDAAFASVALEAIEKTLAIMEREERDSADGLFRGGACFQDGISAYPDQFVAADWSSGIAGYLQNPPPGAVIASTGGGLPMKALSTNVLCCEAYRIADRFRRLIGLPEIHAEQASELRAAIHRKFYRADTASYRYLLEAGDSAPVRQEGLGYAFALLFGIMPEAIRGEVVSKVYRTAHGLPCVWPQMERYTKAAGQYARHSGTVWPQVNAAWCIALADNGFRREAWQETVLLAEKAVRDGMFHEVYHPDTGLPYGGIQENGREKGIVEWASCPRQTWAATGYIRMVLTALLGLRVDSNGLSFSPILPEECDEIRLEGLHYRKAVVNLTVRHAASSSAAEERRIPAAASGTVELTMNVPSYFKE